MCYNYNLHIKQTLEWTSRMDSYHKYIQNQIQNLYSLNVTIFTRDLAIIQNILLKLLAIFNLCKKIVHGIVDDCTYAS